MSQQTTLSIAGMSCDHCVAAVKQALASVPSVVVKDVGIGTATIEVDSANLDAVKAAVEDAGYSAEIAAR